MLGANIKKIREKKGLGLNELARKAEINSSYLSAIENGKKKNPTITILNKLAYALEVTTDELILNKIEKCEKKEISNIKEKVDVFLCEECGYEDSSFIPSGMYSEDDKQHKKGYICCPECKKIVPKNIIQMNFADYMTLEEYIELVNYINKNHNFSKLKGKCIKYISHNFDLRTGKIYTITLNGKIFAKTNENRHKDLKKWIMDYLES